MDPRHTRSEDLRRRDSCSPAAKARVLGAMFLLREAAEGYTRPGSRVRITYDSSFVQIALGNGTPRRGCHGALRAFLFTLRRGVSFCAFPLSCTLVGEIRIRLEWYSRLENSPIRFNTRVALTSE